MTAPEPEHQQLHFYPGAKRLLFIVDSKLVLNVEAWGGPEFPIPRRGTEKYDATPTTPGRFRVGWIGRYRTSSWDYSKIRWGTPIKLHPTDDKDLLYEASPGHWKSVRQKVGARRDDILADYRALYHDRKIPDRWC